MWLVWPDLDDCSSLKEDQRTALKAFHCSWLSLDTVYLIPQRITGRHGALTCVQCLPSHRLGAFCCSEFDPLPVKNCAFIVTSRSPSKFFLKRAFPFQMLFCELFPNRICELNPKDLENVPSGTSGSVLFPFYLFVFMFHASCFILKGLSLHCRKSLCLALPHCALYIFLCARVSFSSLLYIRRLNSHLMFLLNVRCVTTKVVYFCCLNLSPPVDPAVCTPVLSTPTRCFLPPFAT